MKNKVSIGADHGGFFLKNAISESLKSEGFEVFDKGTFSTDSVDYPDYAKAVCDSINSGESEFGILVCTTGIGMSIAANKIKGIRAALVLNADAAKFSRLHNNANVICLGQKNTSLNDALNFVKIFAETDFEGGRHERRILKFSEFENC